jgi:hypothetical protein
MNVVFIMKLNMSLKYQKKPAVEYSSFSSTHRRYRPILLYQTPKTIDDVSNYLIS